MNEEKQYLVFYADNKKVFFDSQEDLFIFLKKLELNNEFYNVYKFVNIKSEHIINFEELKN